MRAVVVCALLVSAPVGAAPPGETQPGTVLPRAEVVEHARVEVGGVIGTRDDLAIRAGTLVLSATIPGARWLSVRATGGLGDASPLGGGDDGGSHRGDDTLWRVLGGVEARTPHNTWVYAGFDAGVEYLSWNVDHFSFGGYPEKMQIWSQGPLLIGHVGVESGWDNVRIRGGLQPSWFRFTDDEGHHSWGAGFGLELAVAGRL